MRAPARVFGLLLALTVFVAPGLSANGTTLSSAMVAKCLGTDCQRVSFTLDIAGDVFVNSIRLTTRDENLWQFGSLIQVLDENGVDITSAFKPPEITSDGVELLAYTAIPYEREPLTIIVQMAQWSHQGDLFEMIDYHSFGDRTSPLEPNPSPFLTGGTATVTPEPETWFLLATGLAVLGWVGRRRRLVFETEGGGETREI
ncbi:MAG: PEP-CTERM sorting domain-containing protein [Longimicrobiales bacterium]